MRMKLLLKIGAGVIALVVIALVAVNMLISATAVRDRVAARIKEQSGRDLIRRALGRDVGVIVAGAYASGILAKGSGDPDSRYWYRTPSQETRDRVAAVEALCIQWGCTLPAVAIAFCLRGPVIIVLLNAL